MNRLRFYVGFFCLCWPLWLVMGCKPGKNEVFILKVAEFTKQQQTKKNQNIFSHYVTASDRQASDLEKKGLLYKKMATKYIELTWLRSTININLAKTMENSGLTAKDDPLSRASLPVPGDLEYDDYKNALHYLQLSLEIFNMDENLFFNAGLCCAHIGKYFQKKPDAPESLEWFNKAKAYYSRAISLDANYIDALYGLAILLVFELQTPAQGIEYLLRIKTHERYNTDARFLLAYTYYITGDYRQAIREYAELEKLTKKPELREQARRNKQQIIEMNR